MNGLDQTAGRRKALYLGTTALSPPARLLAAPMLGVALLAAAPAAANPTGSGGAAVVGTATIAGEGTALVTINQTTDRAVIDWTSFGISTGETTNFVQPGTGSITLNRVTGGTQSAIFGNLTANGQVWLINPNGVVMDGTAVINTGGFLATTADITNTDFMDGNNQFDFNTGSAAIDAVVSNAGSITVADTGLVALVAPAVRNSGTITANLGTVVLGGTETFALDLDQSGLLMFAIGAASTVQPDKPEGGGSMLHQVDNTTTGSIVADGGTVVLSAKSLGGVGFNLGVNMEGLIQAQSAVSSSGTVVLSSDTKSIGVNGTIDARGLLAGTMGGAVDITGPTVTMNGISTVDVTGVAGGGSINGNAASGQFTTSGNLLAGDGNVSLVGNGQVLQGSGQITAGNLSMNGGTGVAQGSGGGITASGALTLTGGVFVAMTGAANALSGPISMSSGGLITLNNSAAGATTFGSVSAGTTLEVNLTGGGLVQQGGTSITATQLDVAAVGDVTLMEAGNDVNQIAVVTSGALAFRDADDLGIKAGSVITASDVTLDAGGLLSITENITGGNVSLTGAGVTFSANTAGGAATTVDAGTGTLSIDGGTGTITTNFDGGTTNGTLLLTTGTVELAADEIDLATGSQTGGSGLTAGQAATAILRPSSGGQSVAVGGAGGTGALDLTAAELATVRSTDLRLGDPSAGALAVAGWSPAAGIAPGVLTLASGAGITQTGAIDLSVSGSNLILRAGTGATLANAGNDFNRVAAVTTTGGFTLTDANTLTISQLTDDLGTVTALNAPVAETLTAVTVVWEFGAPAGPPPPPPPVPVAAPVVGSVPAQVEAAAGNVCDPDSDKGGKGVGVTAACSGDTARASGKEKLLQAEGLEIAGLD